MRCFLPLASLILAACFQPASSVSVSGDDGSCTVNCTHRGSGGAASGSGGGGSSSSGSTPSGGSSSGGSAVASTGSSSSGSSGASVSDGGPIAHICPMIATPPLFMSCPGGAPLAAQIVDAIQCTVIAGATLSALGADGIPLAGASAVSDANGAFVFCVPYATPFTATVTATGYLNAYLAELTALQDAGAVQTVSQIALIQRSFLVAFSGFVPGGYDSSEGLIIANISGPGNCEPDATGWTLSLALPDGGAFPDGGDTLVYFGSSDVPDPTATETSADGTAVIVNIETPATGFVAVDTSKANPGACPIINAQLGFTGRVLVGGNSCSYMPFILQ